nr:class I SAM-dependent methyltransferase [Neobacillus sp. Marseille-Q6967]
MKQVDFSQVAKSYAQSREDIPSSLMESLFVRGIFFDGKKVADIGCGTGAFTRKMAMRKADVVGVDPSKELLEQAKALNSLKNYTIPYVQSPAEATGLPDSKYDYVTVMRAWHWFGRQEALDEVKRILKTNGTLIIIDSGFLSETTVVEKTFGVLTRYVDGELKPAGSKADSRQRINGFPVEWFLEWQQSGFELRDFYKLNYSINFSKQEWIERVESISWMAGLNPEVRQKALLDLSDSLPDLEPYSIPHECNVCILRITQ